jgi:hypothetical protein
MAKTCRRWVVVLLSGVALLSGCGAVSKGDDASEVSGESDADGNASGDAVVLYTAPTPAATVAAALAAAATIEHAFLVDRVGALADDAMAGRDNNTAGGLAARAWLVADLKGHGLAPALEAGFSQVFDVGGVVGANLCARVVGADPALRHEHLVIGAHYDHLGRADAPGSACKAKAGATDVICNGAIDNAAGVAVAIAVTRALAQSGKLRRSLLLCLFDAEEDGIVGSKHFVANAPLVPLADIVAMFSVDNVGSQIVPGEASSFATDAEFSDGLRAAVHATNAATGYQTWPVSSFFVGQDGGGRSDHQPFREAGVPVLFLGSGSSAVYHTPADEPGAVDFTKLLAIARHTAVLVAMVANAEIRPTMTATPLPHLDDAYALRSLADRVLADPAALGLNDGQAGLVKTWRDELSAWIDKPPETAAQWQSYHNLVKAIIKAVFTFAG